MSPCLVTITPLPLRPKLARVDMRRYVSRPIPHPGTQGEGPRFTRADLIFEEVDPVGESYMALVFLNSLGADHTTAIEGNVSFAGWFTVFGHGGCFGDDELHCAPPSRASDFELRVPVGIPLQTKAITVTDALSHVTSAEFTVTVVAVLPSADGPLPTDALQFNRLSLVTYQD